MLRVEGLSKRYGAITAVNNVSFHVSKGEIHGLVGPNGSGKTTTFKSIIGLVRPDQGRIFLDNYNLLNDNDRKRVKMGFVPESLSIPGWMKVSDFLYSMSLMYGLDKREAKNRVEEVTNILGLENLLDKKLDKISKGQKKRVLIANAFLADSDIYVLDEPMTGLDPEWVVKVRELIRSKAKDSVILVSSHLLRELEAIIDSVTVIYYGRTLFSGSLEELNGILGRERKILLKTNDRNRACELIKEMGYECVLKEGWVEVSVSDSFQQKKIVKKLVEADVDVFELKSVETTLEEAYLRLLKGVKK